ncbi:EF-P 5-aminopentanol modification-associated protein YfmF [Macrococcoides caseolyticum]|uniref:EF-P 5-aminopentanol modification-associated protein YfmF n=1 Tax=Macrococcoides caseolyticum TaxID=69966 RepID=UPI001F34B53F|nr:pitrilysin family protein [Macrococcus caseolyticus]MCE4957230.1 insulinase family protein [Macrococcus caseolyticus]
MAVHLLNTDKFKTVSIVLKFKAPLDIQTMSERAILSKLIQKTSKRYPNEQAMINHLAYLYGANLYSHVIKQNNAHVFTVGIDVINDKYLEDEDVLQQAFQLLNEVIYHPNVDDFQFKDELINVEKHLFRNKYDAIKENLGQYGFYQLLKAMFEDQSMQNPAFGDIHHLYTVTGHDVYRAYQSMLNQDEVELFVVGDIDSARINTLVHQYLKLPDNCVKLSNIKLKQRHQVQTLVEHIDTKQARINMGYQFDVRHAEKSYFSFIILNQIFGGDPSSLLFTNVREKLSLAYQIHSQIDARSGILYVLSGVNQDKRQQAIDTIQAEFENIKSGNFDVNLLETAKRLVINQKKESLDRPKGFIEIEFSNTFGSIVTEEEWIKGINAVTKEDIIQLAQTGILHTIHCLTSEESE